MKNTRFSVFVAALLCVVIALSSCTGSAAIPSGDELANDRTNEGAIVPVEGEGAGEGDENLPEIDTTTTSGKIAVWQKYLGYKAKVDNVAGDKTGSDLYINDYDYESAPIDEFGIVVRTYYDEEELTAEADAGKIKIHEGFTIFNPYVTKDALKTFSFSYKADEITHEPVGQVTRVSWDEGFYGVFVIKYEAWDAVYEELPEGSTEAPSVIGYEIKKTTYDAYLCDGTQIADGVSSLDLEYSILHGRYTVFCGDDAYILDAQGRLVEKVAKVLADCDPFLYPEAWGNDFEKIGNYYVTSCGDGLGFFNENGILISVLDYELVFADNKAMCLADGRVLLQSFNYDYNNPVVKTNIFDPATGKLSAVEFNYIIENCVDVTSEEMTVADGFVFVEAYAVENGVAATELTYLVLKSDLTVEATLPEIVMNQSGAIEFVDSDTFLVPASVGERVYAYRVTDGNFYAFDFEIVEFYNGMLKVRDADGEYNIVDMSGKVIVADINSSVREAQSSIIVSAYDEEYEVTKYYVCYYDTDDDTVRSYSIYTSEEDDRYLDVYTEMDGKFIVVTYRRYDSSYERSYYHRIYYNVEGTRLYSLTYTSSYGNVYEYETSSSTTTYTVEAVDAHEAIVFLVSYEDDRSSTEYDYIRYDIIK